MKKALAATFGSLFVLTLLFMASITVWGIAAGDWTYIMGIFPAILVATVFMAGFALNVEID